MLRRHDLLRVDCAEWDAMLARHIGLASEPLINDWARNGHPVIVRRFFDSERTDRIPVGAPLPLSRGKRRTAFDLPADARVRPLPPVRLRDATEAAPPLWRSTIAALSEAGAKTDCTPHIFGALLWRHLTGLAYLSATSDLDLLWEPTDRAVLTLLRTLSAIDDAAPMRLDGEFVLPDGGAVNWRELWNARQRGRSEVLVKKIDGVEMRSSSNLFAEAVTCQ